MLLGKPWTSGAVWGLVQMMHVTADLDSCRWTGQRAGRERKESVCGTEAAGVSGQSPPDAGQGECTASIGAAGGCLGQQRRVLQIGEVMGTNILC